MRIKQSGFTLVEVLIALVIVVSTIALSSAIYSNAIASSSKATSVLKINAVTPLLLDEIRQSLRDNRGESASGRGNYNGVAYTWQSRLLKRGKPIPRVNIDASPTTPTREKFFLWQVTLSMEFEQNRRQFSFKEVSWE